MPFNTQQLATIPLELFGGLCSEVEPAVIPEGSSPLLSNVEFDVGDVHQRRGLQQILSFTGVLANPGAVNYTKTFIMANQDVRTLAYAVSGTGLSPFSSLAYEDVSNAPGTLTPIANNIAQCMDSVTAFEREYIAFSDGQWGTDVPTQYDGTNYNRISQDGPGYGGTAADSGAAGNVSAGAHQWVVMFLTQSGYITRPCPIQTWTAAGSKKVALTNLPIGPSNVVARIIAFTAAGVTGFFFYIPVPTAGSTTGTVINDNVSTTATLDFTDATLQAATSISTAGNNLFAMITLGNVLGSFCYSGRTFFWGERNKIQNLLNPSFDGGFDNATGTTPLGWTNVTAGGLGVATTFPAGFAYQITVGNNPATKYGEIQQSAAIDSFNAPIFSPSLTYVFRAKITGTVRGSLVALLSSVFTGFSASATITVPATFAGGIGYVSAAFTLPTPAVIPGDLLLQVYGTNGTTPTVMTVDELEFYPQNNPYLGQQLRVSYFNNPESFDGITGIVGLAEAGAENIKRVFQIREVIYIQTDQAIYSTSDNGLTEPSGWSISKVSNTVGSPSVHGGAAGEEFDISAHRTGLYIFNGSEPTKSNQEIFRSVSGATIAWDQINWPFAYTIWVANDVARRQVFIGVPVGAAQSPNQILMMDYKELNTSSQISSEGPIHTSYSGKVISWEPGRKWSPWPLATGSGNMCLRQDGTYQLLLGSNTGSSLTNGLINQPVEGQLSDNGAAINSFYFTYAFPSQEISQQNPMLGTNRQLFSFLTMFVAGAGTLNIGTYPLSVLNAGPSYVILLNAAPIEDTEIPIRVAGERVFISIGTNAVGSWWKLSRFGIRLRSHPWSRIRHVN